MNLTTMIGKLWTQIVLLWFFDPWFFRGNSEKKNPKKSGRLGFYLDPWLSMAPWLHDPSWPSPHAATLCTAPCLEWAPSAHPWWNARRSPPGERWCEDLLPRNHPSFWCENLWKFHGSSTFVLVEASSSRNLAAPNGAQQGLCHQNTHLKHQMAYELQKWCTTESHIHMEVSQKCGFPLGVPLF